MASIQKPIFQSKPGNASELAGIVGDQDAICRPGDRSDPKVRFTNDGAQAFHRKAGMVWPRAEPQRTGVFD